MTREDQTLRDDIAYMRALADEGRSGPLLAGPVLVAAGLIFGLANIGQWAITNGMVDLSPWAPLWLWSLAGVVFAATLMIQIGQMKRKAGSGSTANMSLGAAWSSVGYGIFVSWVSLIALSVKTGSWDWMIVMPMIVLVAYGSAWMIGAATARVKWMGFVGLLSYLGAIAVMWFSDSAMIYLVFTLILLLVALVPGLVMMGQAKAGAR